jgi:hypothetical protein
MSLPPNFNDLPADERAARLSSARDLAAADNAVQRAQVEYRTRELKDWIAVETRQEREARKAAERLDRRAAAAEAERIHKLEERREQQRHEWLIARTYAEAANGNGNGNGADVSNDFTDALVSIGEVLNNLLARVEALETQRDKTDAVVEASARRFDYVETRTLGIAEKATAQLKGAIDEVKADVGFLKFRLDVLNSKRNEPLEQRIVVIPG